MERKNKCKKVGFSTVLYTVLLMLVCAAPSVAEDIWLFSGDELFVQDGSYILNDTTHQGGINCNIWVYDEGRLDITGGVITGFISVSENANVNVTVSGKCFEVGEDSYNEEGTYDAVFIRFESGPLTGTYENGTQVNLTIDCAWGTSDEGIVEKSWVRLVVSGCGVGIDIKPGSYPNSLNINGNGVIPVAILGSADFDVTQIVVDVDTPTLAGLAVRVKPNGVSQYSIDDVSGPGGVPDGFDDLVCQFVDDPELWEPGIDFAELTGYLEDGTEFAATDEIKIVP